MDTLRQDLAYALRVLVKRPGLTLVALLTLAIGIAANSTIFTLINSVLIRPLPYPQADRLVNLWTVYPSAKGQQDIFSPPNYVDVAARANTIESAGAYTTFSFTLAGGDLPEYVPGIQMTASLADVLQVEPRLGRWFSRAEDDAGADLAIISDSLWRTMFGGDPSILGRSVIVNGKSVSIIGVMPPQSGFGFPTIQTQVYMPIISRRRIEPNPIAGMSTSMSSRAPRRARSRPSRPSCIPSPRSSPTFRPSMPESKWERSRSSRA